MSSHGEMLCQAEHHLQSSCPHMRRLIAELGPCQLQTRPDGFEMLVRSITSQQLSGTASKAIRRRLINAIKPQALTPVAVRACGEEGLRSAGYSGRKASYLLGLCADILDGGLDLGSMAGKSDDEVIRRLTLVRGIGEWTAQMFLIFSLGRPDVFPHGDLGVRQSLKRFHGLESLPGKRLAIALASPWRPYATVASWYCWRSIDAKPTRKAS